MHRIQRAFTFKMMYRNLGTSGGATNSLNRALIRSHHTDYLSLKQTHLNTTDVHSRQLGNGYTVVKKLRDFVCLLVFCGQQVILEGGRHVVWHLCIQRLLYCWFGVQQYLFDNNIYSKASSMLLVLL